MRLAKIQDVLDKIGYESSDDLEVAIRVALDMSTLILSSKLRTEFGLTSVTDIFYVKKTDQVGDSMVRSSISATSRGMAASQLFRDQGGPSYQTRLLLSKGFVKPSPAMTLIAANTRAKLVSDSSDISEFATTTAERGVVMLTDADESGLYIQVGYDAGFDVDADDDQLYDQSEVPDWLSELAILQAIIQLDANPIVRDQENVSAISKMIKESLDVVIEDKIRYEPLASKTMI